MFFIYTPEDGERQEWWFDPKKIRVSEAEAIEKRTGWDWSEFGVHLIQASVLARRALLWTYLRRTHPRLRFEDVDFAMDEIELEFSREELEAMRAQLGQQDGLSTQERAQLAALDEQIEQARPGPGKAQGS